MQNEYSSSEIAARIKIIAKSKGFTLSTILKEVNLGRNTMANFKTSMPKADNLAKIADYLDCSIDYLMGRTDNPYVTLEAKDEMEIEMLKAFKSLGFSEKIEVMNTIIEKRNKLK